MQLTGLHLLLTYQCLYQCDHCFVWSSPDQPGTMTIPNVERILNEGLELGTVEWIYFEGGEPFLYYPLLSRGVEMARDAGFKVGIVTNSYWAGSLEDALEGLRPLGLIQDLSVSVDAYHGAEDQEQRAAFIRQAAAELGIPMAPISIGEPDCPKPGTTTGKLPAGESPVRFRGRAVSQLAAKAPQQPWTTYTQCVPERLDDPGRVHIDPLGHIHVCQGISIGNVFTDSLREIWERYEPTEHPITGPLLSGGPAALAREHDVDVRGKYADCCHLCYETRMALRPRFPEVLAPDQMYGDV
jgi:MoaA/NifB/PqqE/SkfB family radical SAM enzyme